MFDRVVIINLKRRNDRLDRLLSHLQDIQWPLPAPVVFEAVDASKVPVPPGWHAGGGAWGCMQSHRQVLERAMMDGVNSLLVLEDDVYFVEGFREKLKAFMAGVPDDWEQLMLGGQYVDRDGKHSRKVVAPGIERVEVCERTHCYAVRGQFMRDLYAKWCASSGHCDHVMGPFQRGRRVYAPTEFLAGQAAGVSDISGGTNCDTLWVKPPKNWPVTLFIGSPEAAAEYRAKHHKHSGHNLKNEVDIGLTAILEKPEDDRAKALKAWVEMIEWEGRSKTPERQCMIYGVSEELARAAVGDRLTVVGAKPCGGCGGKAATVTTVRVNDPEVWGPRKWLELHSRPDAAKDLSREIAWLSKFRTSLPCEKCREHLAGFMEAIPPRLDSADEYFAWTVELHNAVNRSLDRPEFPLDAAQRQRDVRAGVRERVPVCQGCDFYERATSKASPRCQKITGPLKNYRERPENACPLGRWKSQSSQHVEVFWHVAAMPGAWYIIEDQMAMLAQSSLRRVNVTFLGNPSDLDRLKSLAAVHAVELRILRSDANLNHYETFAMIEIEKWAKSNSGIILYLHTKGASAPKHQGKQRWRALMENEVVRNWQANVSALENHDAIGCNWRQFGEHPHFAGNFWMARAEYLRRLPSFAAYHHRQGLRRFSCESWIGQAKPRLISLAHQNVDYCDRAHFGNP